MKSKVITKPISFDDLRRRIVDECYTVKLRNMRRHLGYCLYIDHIPKLSCSNISGNEKQYNILTTTYVSLKLSQLITFQLHYTHMFEIQFSLNLCITGSIENFRIMVTVD